MLGDLTEFFVEPNQVREEEVHHNVLQKVRNEHLSQKRTIIKRKFSVMSARGMDITKLIVQLSEGEKSSATSAKELDTLSWNASTIRKGDVRSL